MNCLLRVNSSSVSLKLKEDLFQQNPTCQICGQHIHDIDDAEVDHIQHYWQGGKTIPENARLSHRYCNRARGGKLQYTEVLLVLKMSKIKS